LHGKILELERERQRAIAHGLGRAEDQVRQLLRLRAIGPSAAWVYVNEFFGWRQFRNRKEVGAAAGLTPTPFQSGAENREQGISKAGSRHIRAVAIEMAWCWLRYQPRSRLSRWYHERFGRGGARARKVGIVALARKLLIELWRFLEHGVIPDGAALKA
jgi:transposase